MILAKSGIWTKHIFAIQLSFDMCCTLKSLKVEIESKN